MDSPVETEVKIRIGEALPAARALEAAGFSVTQPREFESNTLYDTRDRSLLAAGVLLRLRQSGGRFILTFKGPAKPGPHKSRPELETTVGSCDVLDRVLHELGYSPVFRYEKYRRVYQAPGDSGVVTLDETPIGNFLELEGCGEWIDGTARRLGFARSEYILESYGRLYLKHCAQEGAKPGDMVFTAKESQAPGV
jgi:adenylate cyclase, class 2